MCGICGKLSGREPVERELIEGMCDSIVHRGPSSQGAFLDEGVGLGVRRLAVIDLDTGDQPIFNEDESVVVVLNGEIYNYVELRDELEAAGHSFRTRTDTEVIVHLYEDHGEACVEWLRGMFAFALWDRASRRLLLARDRVGKKPLFYAIAGERLWFASEPKAVLRDPELTTEPDYAALDAYLRLGYVPAPKSAFAALRKLPPAHTLSWDGREAWPRRYWKLSYRSRSEGLHDREMRELIRQELLEATRLRLRSDVPLGAFLSGGVDSTAVVAAMAQQASGPVRTYSIGFDVASHDETRYAAEVARVFDTEHHETMVEPHAVEVLPELVWHYGEPYADASAVPTWYLSHQTASEVTVALNGDGGDESFAGYTRYLNYERIRRFEWLPQGGARRAADALARVIKPGSSPRPLRQLRWLAEGLSAPLPERYAATMASVPPATLARLVTPDFERSVEREDAPAPAEIVAAILARSDADNRVEQLLDVDVNTYLPDDLLVKVDIASMAHSLEVRSPLLDQRLMETVAGLPLTAKQRGTAQKRLLKDVLREWVPGDILDRPKKGFSPPLADWLRGELRDLPGEVLLDPASLERGLFQEDGMRAVIDEHRDGRGDHAQTLWTLLQLELWFRTYVDVSSPSPLASLTG